jgi:hypothetical protein
MAPAQGVASAHGGMEPSQPPEVKPRISSLPVHNALPLSKAVRLKTVRLKTVGLKAVGLQAVPLKTLRPKAVGLQAVPLKTVDFQAVRLKSFPSTLEPA